MMPYDIGPSNVEASKFTSLTSVHTKCTLPAYKLVLGDKQQSIMPANLEMVLVTYCLELLW